MDELPPTKRRLLETGMRMLLKQGYSDLGVQTLLDETCVPKGSFYHHFESKEDFALQAIDLYMEEVHGALDACLGDESRRPVDRVRAFFAGVEQKYEGEGYLGCLLGGLGQELSGISEVFRRKVEACFAQIARRIEACFKEAVSAGDLPEDFDCKAMANLLVDCWEGAALRSRMRRNPRPLRAMLDFYFGAVSKTR
jgi:TetR/AcrR family transcriptional repressor of nem operon